MTRTAFLLPVAILLAACDTSSSCGPGLVRGPNGECVPDAPPDGGMDAGDATVVDAGPCGACGGDTPLCRESDRQCVQCLGDDDCSGDASHCDLEAGRCVPCLENAHCTDPEASRCDTAERSCVACQNNSDCQHLDGTQVCDSGTCVQCTSAERSACGPNVCNASTRTCSAYPANQRTCEPCDTDDNCAAGHHCVPMFFMGSPRPTGYCLKQFDPAEGCEQPFSVLLSDRTSLSGATGHTYCGINETLTTCEAVRALLNDQECSSGMDSDCPEGGLCRTLGGVATNRCTYPCDLGAQCPNGAPANTCGRGGSPDGPNYCGG